MTWIEILSIIFGAGGFLGFLSYLLFFKEEKRIRKAGATKEELANLEKSIEILQGQVKHQGDEIQRLQTQLKEKNQLIQKLYKERDVLEKTYAEKKSAINCAVACPYSVNCPVLLRIRNFEKEKLSLQYENNTSG